MFEQQPQELRQKVKRLANEAIAASDPSAWFETLYAEAERDAQNVPWARLMPHFSLLEWLEARNLKGEGKSALAIGCGLGDDAEALSRLGFQVTAFDISPTAIAWCQQRFPHSSVRYQVADLLKLDPAWHRAFDFVLEVRNIQALPLSIRPSAIAAIAPLLAPGGTLLVVTRFRRDTEDEPDGPPWALSETELFQFQQLGLQERDRHIFFEGETNPIKHLRLEYCAPRL
jgi:SAM-dependent methyltransferase